MGSCVSSLGGRICGLIDKAKSRHTPVPDEMDERKRPHSPEFIEEHSLSCRTDHCKRICTVSVSPAILHQNQIIDDSTDNALPKAEQNLLKCSSEKSVASVTLSDVSLSYSSDHINSLPHSLMVHIFRQLTLYDLLHRASLVCKYWLQLSHDSDLWRCIDVQGMLKVDDLALNELTSYSDNVTAIDITDSRLITSSGVVKVLTKCRKLQSFKAARCQQLSDPAFAAIGDHCSHLTRLHLDNCFALTDQALIEIGKGCVRLKHLRLNQCFHIGDDSVIEIAKACPHLVHILLDQCTKITDKSVHALSAHCAELEDASFMGCDLTEEGISSLAKCKKLKTLELSNIRRTSCKAVRQLILHCKELNSLNLCLCNDINDECVEFIAKYGKKLRKLHLVSCTITDLALDHIGKYSTTLEHVDVGWCEKITDHGVRLIADTLKTLRFLGLIRCDEVTIPTMEALVDQYPDITFSTVYLDFKRLMEKAKAAGHIPEDHFPVYIPGGLS